MFTQILGMLRDAYNSVTEWLITFLTSMDVAGVVWFVGFLGFAIAFRFVIRPFFGGGASSFGASADRVSHKISRIDKDEI